MQVKKFKLACGHEIEQKEGKLLCCEQQSQTSAIHFVILRDGCLYSLDPLPLRPDRS